jgi:DNA-binding MarR family transcriptional regulator
MGEKVAGEKMNKMIDDIYLIFPLLHRTLMHPDGLTHNPMSSEFKVMMILQRKNSIPTSKIGKWLGISKPNMTAVIDKLIADDYVEREQNPEDRRIVDISLTDRGRKYMAGCKAEARESVKNRLAAMSEEDITTLYSSLENIRVILMKLNGMNADNPIPFLRMGPPMEDKI